MRLEMRNNRVAGIASQPLRVSTSPLAAIQHASRPPSSSRSSPGSPQAFFMAPSNSSLSVIEEPPLQPGPYSTHTTSPVQTIVVVIILAVLLVTVLTLLSIALVRSRYRSRFGTQEDESASDGTASPAESKIRTLDSLSPRLPQNTFVLKLPLSNRTSPIKAFRRAPSTLALFLRRCLSRRNKICQQTVESGLADEKSGQEFQNFEEMIPQGIIVLPYIRITDTDERSGTPSLCGSVLVAHLICARVTSY